MKHSILLLGLVVCTLLPAQALALRLQGSAPTANFDVGSGIISNGAQDVVIFLGGENTIDAATLTFELELMTAFPFNFPNNEFGGTDDGAADFELRDSGGALLLSFEVTTNVTVDIYNPTTDVVDLGDIDDNTQGYLNVTGGSLALVYEHATMNLAFLNATGLNFPAFGASFGADSVNIDLELVAHTPEPATAVLVGLGLVGLGVQRRRVSA